MTKKIRAAVVGYGNIGKFTVEALEAAEDFEIAGIVRRNGAEGKPAELAPYEVVKDITELKDVDVAILATPTRSCEEYAKKILPLGINTVDSFDIHTNILDYRATLMPINKETGTVSVIAAGWDPGSDSIVRTLMQSLAPKGLSYTNFGPGMSMGHSVCVRSKAGVKNALSMTIPKGEGIHRRMVYVELEEGASLEEVTAAIKAEPADGVQHEHQQPRVDSPGACKCCKSIPTPATRMLHHGGNTCHRHASRRPRDTHQPSCIRYSKAT